MHTVSYFPGDGGVTPKEAMMQDAKDWQGEMALSKLHLFKAEVLTLGPTTTLAELAAAEAAYDGYTAGGVTVTAFNDPVFESGTGAVVHGPLTQFNYVDAGGDPETIAGWYITDAAGILRGAGELDEPQVMGTNDDGIPVIPARVFSN